MARVDAGGLRLTGEGGFLPELIKGVLERGLEAELTDHLGYEQGRPGRARRAELAQRHHPEDGVDRGRRDRLDVPRDRDGTFEPRLVPKGSRRLAGGLDDMIISLYAGGMTVRDIEHHLARTLGAEMSRRDDLQDHRRGARRGQGLADPAAGRGLSDRLLRRDGGEGPRRRVTCATRPRTSPSASTSTGSSTCWASGSRPPRAPSSGLGARRAAQPRRARRADRLLRRADRAPRGDRGDLAAAPCRPAWCT